MRVLKFYADWCAPCSALTESLKQSPLNVPIENINIDEDFETTRMYGIRSIPSVVILDDNDNVVRKGVVSSSRDIAQMLTQES